MKTKKCKTCGTRKKVEQFSKRFNNQDKLRSVCKKCTAKLTHEHYLINKEKYAQASKKWRQQYTNIWWAYKDTLKCLECGFDHPAALDFHHRDAAKKNFDISQAVCDRKNLKLIKTEIEENCDVLCSNCHRIHHYEERQ